MARVLGSHISGCVLAKRDKPLALKDEGREDSEKGAAGAFGSEC